MSSLGKGGWGSGAWDALDAPSRRHLSAPARGGTGWMEGGRQRRGCAGGVEGERRRCGGTCDGFNSFSGFYNFRFSESIWQSRLFGKLEILREAAAEAPPNRPFVEERIGEEQRRERVVKPTPIWIVRLLGWSDSKKLLVHFSGWMDLEKKLVLQIQMTFLFEIMHSPIISIIITRIYYGSQKLYILFI